MSLLSGQYLSPNCFSWSDGFKKDGTARKAGEYVAFIVYEDGPTPAASPVIEVQVPDDFRAEFQKRQVSFKRLHPVKMYVEHMKKGVARLIGWAD
jgi:hypothetical protein